MPSYCREPYLKDGGVLSNLGAGYCRRRLTFINAFESSPVHCLNPRPSGKRRSPGNNGTAAILILPIQFRVKNFSE